jgi:antitoxin (DNA-binding transcriptional repressor) of toxin-antitoxin stability system
MSVHIGRAVSEVVPAPEPAPSSQPAAGAGWAEVDRQRCEQARAERDRARTCAEGFDD